MVCHGKAMVPPVITPAREVVSDAVVLGERVTMERTDETRGAGREGHSAIAPFWLRGIMAEGSKLAPAFVS